MAFDTIYTMTDFYDGPRKGVANYQETKVPSTRLSEVMISPRFVNCRCPRLLCRLGGRLRWSSSVAVGLSGTSQTGLVSEAFTAKMGGTRVITSIRVMVFGRGPEQEPAC